MCLCLQKREVRTNMALTSDQVYLLNTLTYLSSEGIISPSEGMTVGDYARSIQNNPAAKAALIDSFRTESEINAACERIISDTTVSNMEFAYTDRTSTGGDRFVITTPDGAAESQAIVVFEGTVGGHEWRDNFTGGTETNMPDGVSTEEQVNTLDWFKGDKVSNILEQYDKVTVSGHSKGGNKAKYLTLMDDRVDECISFDGQGFSDEFYEKHADKIRQNQDKITNYNAEDDYVNILLNDVGKVIYIKGNDENGFAENHSLFEMVNSYPLSDYETQGNKLLSELNQAINSYLRTLSPNEKKVFLNLLGEITADFLGGDESWGLSDFGDYVSRLYLQGGRDLIRNFLAHMVKYVAFEGVERIFAFLKEKFPFLSDYLDDLLEKARNEAGLHDGNDIQLTSASKADRIIFDTDVYRQISGKLDSIARETQHCASLITESAQMCGDNRIRLNITLSIPMLLIGAVKSVLSGVLESLLNDLSSNTKKISEASSDIASSLRNIVAQVEQIENMNTSSVPKTSGNEAPYAHG